MAKLFALEEMDETGADVEMEASPEVGEVADVQVDMGEDVGGVEDQAEAISEGVAAADQLGEVEDVVADAAEGEGLDPVAAEAIRIAVEAICSRIGANPKAIYSLYATENFQSASSRKANSKIALEGVGEFLKDLWKKIKAAVASLWGKVKAFWDKHFSSLGRIRKAIDSTREKVSASSGKLKGKAYMEEAPSYLVNSFAGKDDISATVVDKFLKAHKKAHDVGEKLAQMGQNIKIGADLNAATMKALIKSLTVETKFQLGSETEPLVGGKYTVYTIESEAEDATFDVTVERETIDNKDTKLGIALTDKKGLSDIVKSASDLIKDIEKLKEKSDKLNTSFNKVMIDVEKLLNKVSEVGTKDAKEGVKEARQLVKIVYKAQSKFAGLLPEVFGNDIACVKAALGFVSFNLGQFKSA